MKKYFTVTLVLFLLVSALAGCQSSNAPEEAEAASAGGWTVSTEAVTPAIPQDAKEAFDAAAAELTDSKYEPLAYLGSQVVAGVNYGFLCRVNAEKLCTVKVYRDLEGKAGILETRDFSIADYVEADDVSYTPDDLAGGWSLDPDAAPAALSEEAQAAFDKAMEGFAGAGFRPLACLGTQVVAGCNFAFLCNAVTVTAQPQSALAVVTVYADLDGGAQVTSVCGFDFP